MNCRNKLCNKVILNRRNAINGNGDTYCCSECFIDRDLKIGIIEDKAQSIRTKIGTLKSMQRQMYYIHRPDKSAELDIRIRSYRQNLELVYNELKEL